MESIYRRRGEAWQKFEEVRRRSWQAKRPSGPWHFVVDALRSFVKPRLSNLLIYFVFLCSGIAPLVGSCIKRRPIDWSFVLATLAPCLIGITIAAVMIGLLWWRHMENRYGAESLG